MPTHLRRAPAPDGAPAELALQGAEQLNASAGHENAGFLSAERGFLPLSSPRTRMNARFSAWDELAADLPALHANLQLRARVEGLPLLDATSASLPAAELPRASALLAVLAHAYWYVETRAPDCLPAALSLPWQQVRRRLGREQEVLSYIDLIVYNWRPRDPSRSPLLAFDNLELLLPTVGNQEERVFYLTQLDILARSIPVVSLVAAAQSAVVRDDSAALESQLERLAACLVDCTRALAQIDPRPHAASHVDPVRWAKTVAPFAVPIRRGDVGPSGTSSPLFNTLDAFFGRERFDSPLGQEIKQLRAGYPPAWRAFLAALGQVDIRAFVARTRSPALRAAWDHALDSYAGDRGFLGRHRAKVYGYLEIAFKVGRTLTIGGFSGPFSDRTWNEVDDALASARAERPAPLAVPRPAATASPCPAPRQSSYAWSEIAQHNTDERGYWLVVDGSVYDVTTFLARHPGGPAILRAYAGIDASHGFARAHAGRGLVEAVRAKLWIGEVRVPSPKLTAAGRALLASLQLVVEMQNALELDLSFSLGQATTNSLYERERARERQARFRREYVQILSSQTLPRLLEAVGPTLFPAPHEHEPQLLIAQLQRSAAVSPRAADQPEAERRDRRLLHELKSALIHALRPLEQSSPSQRDTTRARHALWRCAAALRRYQCRN